MNIHNYYTPRNLILAAALTIGLVSSALAQTQERIFFVDLNSKEVTDLGTLGGGWSHANAINNAGQVVGTSGYGHAFITGPDGVGMTDLGIPGGLTGSTAYGINDTGQVVGQNGQYHAFITGPNGVGMTDLDTLGGYYSTAYGINGAGQVVGESDIGVAGQTHAFITGPNGVGMTDLGTLGGRYSYTAAYGINGMGQVVGESVTADGYSPHAFITGPNGVGMTDLGTLGGVGSRAYGINDIGQAVGYAHTANGEIHAFVTGPDGVGMTDLGSVVNPPTGFAYFSGATAINNHGQLAAAGIVPEPEIYAMLLLGLGLIGYLARGRATAYEITTAIKADVPSVAS